MKKAASELTTKLQILGEKQGSIKLADLSLEMSLTPEDTLNFLRQVFPVGTGMEIYHKENETWVDIKSEAIQYMLPLSPAEWMQLHQLVATANVLPNPAFYSLKKKLSDNGPIKVVMEMLTHLEKWDHQLNDKQQEIVKELEASILDGMLLSITTIDEKCFTVHPCKVLHLEGHLSLIAEDFQDHCLVVVPMKDVADFKTIETHSRPKVTAFEIEEFISAIRSMSEKETRLILKIHDPESTNLFPDHHFLGKPCMITNPNGDLIWAAYVEPCEALYDWLITLGKRVEILDPIKFKDEYLTYCEEKLRKIA
jgi:predicted DNA-binding transcriptional regulator YafY